MRCFRYLVLVSFVGLTVSALTASAGLQNAAFEDVATDGSPVGWKMPKKGWSVVRGAGYNGSAGLVYENDDPAFYSNPIQEIKVEIGRSYRFGALIRNFGLKTRAYGASLAFECWDKNGKSLGGTWLRGPKAEKGEDWYRYECQTRPVPEGTTRCTLSCFVYRGSTGKAAYDHVFCEPVDKPVVGHVYSSAYREIVAGEPVTFFAPLHLPKDVGPVTATFEYDAASGGKGRVKGNVADGFASVKMDSALLRLGIGEVTCTVSKKDGSTLGSASLKYECAATPVRRKVAVDRFNRLTVDGKPFFPLGMYWEEKYHAAHLEDYAKGPFNCVIPDEFSTADKLDRYWEKGLYVIQQFRSVFPGSHVAFQMKLDSREKVEKYLHKRMDLVKDHPALLMWYVNDEAPLSEVEGRTQYYEILRAYDPHHPCYSVLDYDTNVAEFLPTYDIVGVDPYPIPVQPITRCIAFARTARRVTFGARMLCHVPQTFSWHTPSRKAQMPTEQEMRNMIWQHIAGGANGLINYAFTQYYRHPEDGTFAEQFARVCRVSAEVRDRTAMLLSEPGPAATFNPDRLAVRTWKTADGVAFAAVNLLREPVRETVEIGGKKQTLEIPALGVVINGSVLNE